jgi:hypothetical protein
MAEAQSYQYLLDAFGQQVLQDRFSFIHKEARGYLLAAKYPDDLFTISKHIIEEVVLDYFADIHRLNDFHHIERSEPEKVAAYTAYWIWRRKPIQLRREPTTEEIQKLPLIHRVNDTFARILFIGMVYDLRKPLLTDMSRYRRFREVLSYFMEFRAVNPQALELAIYALNATPVYERISPVGH